MIWLVYTATALIVVLTFVWPGVAPESQDSAAYRVLAVTAFCGFLAGLAGVLWEKACRRPRT
jgi:hypothetical protein